MPEVSSVLRALRTAGDVHVAPENGHQPRDQEQAEVLVQVTPPSFEVQGINNARTTWLNVHAADGTDYSVLHNDDDGFTDLDALISTGGVRFTTGRLSRSSIDAVDGYTQLATVNEASGLWHLVILTPQAH